MDNMEKNKNWFAVKGLFRWYYKDSGDTALFEERVILFSAESFDDALDQAELEACEYCIEDPKANFKIESLNKYTAHEILEKELSSGIELLSQRPETDMDTKTYLAKYHSETTNKN